MKNKIGKIHKETFIRCQGNCQVCVYKDGNCQLQKIIKKYGLDHIRNLVYNEKIDIPVKIKRGRGRPRKIKTSSEETLRQAKETLGKGIHRGFVYIKCIRCGEEKTIHTQNKELYTEEIKKNFICVTCKGGIK